MVTPAFLGGALGLSVIINVILIIVVVILVTKKRNTFAPPLPPSSVNEGEGGKGTMDIEMKPNSLYGLTSGSESIVTKPNEVYGVSQSSHPEAYEYVNPL